jgi:toxin ParE1/3/4
MKSRLTPRAAQDLIAIDEYLRAESPVGARNVSAAIDAAIGELREHPMSGRRSTIENIRSRAVRGYPYKIYYSLVSGVVEVIHVRHTSRRVWKGELP